MTTNEMTSKLREMAEQILTPRSPSKRMFKEMADRLEQLEKDKAELLKACKATVAAEADFSMDTEIPLDDCITDAVKLCQSAINATMKQENETIQSMDPKTET